MACTSSCCGEGGRCEDGGFAHTFFLCLSSGFAASKDVCECTVPGCAYMSAPGVLHRQFLCFYSTDSWTPAPTLPVNFWCLINWGLCGCDIGNYQDKEPIGSESTTVAPPGQQAMDRPTNVNERMQQFQVGGHRPQGQ